MLWLRHAHNSPEINCSLGGDWEGYLVAQMMQLIMSSSELEAKHRKK